MNRRNFIKNSTFGMVGAGVLAGKSVLLAGEAMKDSQPKIKEYRTLGRTGFEASDIGVGAVPEESLMSAMLDTGINYLDTSPLYMNGECERTIGKVLKNRERKKYFVTTKVAAVPYHAELAKAAYKMEVDVSKEGIMKQFYGSMERLQTGYLDGLMAPAVDKVADVKYQGFHDAVKQLKADGKLKYAGIANHGSFDPNLESREPMEKVLMAAAEDGRYDIFLMVYNHLNHDQGDKIMKVCKDKGVGVTLMKSNPVGTYFGMKESIAKLEKEGKEVPEERRVALSKLRKQYEEAESFLKKYNLEDPGEIMEAAIKFCLNNPNVGSVVLSLENYEDLNRYVKLSGTRLTSADAAALDVFSKSMGQFYCRHACGKCEDKCPQGVPVSTIMRFNHYFAAQGRQKYAMEQYAGLPAQRADQCQDCSGYCESACPYNVPIHTLLALAHQNLTLA